ncbi:proline iminopeptidase-family hydrolase [Flavobacterium sp. MAH-1]|uniref:Proline iminopeptidase-family hydrolase n=1 Tax=Flavobacterium agri TaxID=2743471 RepID=A0A7Y9C602_9FLAO|nr:proline iminopeptidase-family hydrolase [Flavobacterium agri]NUY79712.1 proline iminopeptidase-family hydrolase [Flavobacterium agri]NYA69737.1 proline iminopeptidase-family hydrolase [Flavobacterium agri]
MKALVYSFVLALVFVGCNRQAETKSETSEYFSRTSSGIQNGNVKVIDISTPKGNFKVWTKRFGNNPKMKLLLLNGGPGMSHEYFECIENFLPEKEIEFIYYDQLGTGFSDNPKDTAFWDLARYVEEVEQVRKALNLDKSNFFLLGHSWGGILATEYALKYPNELKGLIISNMMASAPEYGKYSEVLAKGMNPDVLKRIRDIEARKDFENPEYMKLLIPNFYEKHILRLPFDKWPEPVTRAFSRLNASLYVTMQGPSEFGISGRLEKWDRSNDLKNLKMPTLVIGAKYDTMDPKYMEWMSQQIPDGHYLYCTNGSHMSLYDDQKTYMDGLTKFITSVK